MNRLLNVGSLNIDHVYRVPRCVAAGETAVVRDYSRGAGGKGLNQSVAAARAGASVTHAGCIGEDGRFLLEVLREAGVDVSRVRVGPMATGHAVIQVDDTGANTILVHPGANRATDPADAPAFLAGFGPGDWLLVQNETSAVAELIHAAKARGLSVLLNPAPMSPEAESYPLAAVDLLVVNEQEASELTGGRREVEAVEDLARRAPAAVVVLTLGARGGLVRAEGATRAFPAEPVAVVDTTGAGDTFVGFLAAGLVGGRMLDEAIAEATVAAGIAVSRAGAAASIPWRRELSDFPCKVRRQAPVPSGSEAGGG
jgi:ribokinase